MNIELPCPEDLDVLEKLQRRERNAKQRDRYHAVWHVAKALRVPANMTFFLLPRYSPELNPIERLWHWLREHQPSDHVFIDYDDLFESGCRAWNTLTPERLQTVCATSWIKRANQSRCV